VITKYILYFTIFLRFSGLRH